MHLFILQPFLSYRFYYNCSLFQNRYFWSSIKFYVANEWHKISWLVSNVSEMESSPNKIMKRKIWKKNFKFANIPDIITSRKILTPEMSYRSVDLLPDHQHYQLSPSPRPNMKTHRQIPTGGRPAVSSPSICACVAVAELTQAKSDTQASE